MGPAYAVLNRFVLLAILVGTIVGWYTRSQERARTLFYVAAASGSAAVAKLGNGARFRVSSRRGSQVRILAAAILEGHAALPDLKALEEDWLGRLFRPYWFVCWLSLACAAFFLVPTALPIYGRTLSSYYWVLPVVQFSLFGLVYARAWFDRDPLASFWLATASAGLGTELVYTSGTVALLTIAFSLAEYIFIGAFGFACLLTLVLLERWAAEQRVSAHRGAESDS